MSQSPLPSSSKTPTTTTPSNFKHVFEKTLKAYNKKTKYDLTAHPLATQLQACDTPAAILIILQEQVDRFEQSRSADERLHKWLDPTINVLYAFSQTLGEGIGLVFSPAKVIFAGAGVLLMAAMEVEASQDILIDIFERIENFFRRLEVYTQVPPTPAMTDMMVKIMVEVLDILGTATKEMKQSRAKKFLKKVAGIRKLEDGLKKLDKMTNEEARMANAEVLKVAHDIDKKVDGVDEKVQGVGAGVNDVDEKVQGVDEKVQTIIDDGKEAATEVKLIMHTTAHKIDEVKRRQLRESLRKWQSPSDPSTNHIVASDRQHEGTAEWFCKGNIFEEWKATGSLLWIHGKPGSGKSILCSAIINDITTLHKAGLAYVAYFYFDFRDLDKQSRRDLLRSLLVQLSARSDPFCDILSRLYKEHDDGTRQPSDSALMHCLKEMLTLPDQGPVYLIMDALDECPNASGIPSPREQILDLMKDLVGLLLPSLHICVTGRPEVDIQYAIEPLAFRAVSLHDENGQKKDIAEYIKNVVRSPSATFMRRWRDEDQDLVIKTLSEKADGMFRWVFCQLETLRHCLPQNVPRVLSQLPASLDETYERILKEIGTTNQFYARRLLQCLAVAIRPLRVEELAEILALDFDDAKEGIPELRENWRWKDHQEAVLSTCSSLIVVVNYRSRRIVQFSHSSVKEFLTSDRLASLSADISQFHILLEPAHTVIVKACLGILLQAEIREGGAEVKYSSLAKYAAQHWVDHAQFEKVSRRVEDGMRRLFDPAKPYFDAWLKLHDVDTKWYKFTDSASNGDGHHGSPLYYASLCGFNDLAAHLVAENPQHVNDPVGPSRSPLVAALHKRHFSIADLLYQRGADVGIRGGGNRTLLHAASAEGLIDVAQWLLDHDKEATSRRSDCETPPHFSATNGLLWHNIVNAKDNDDRTSLHFASEGAHVEIVRLLLQYGAHVATRDRQHRTPLHLASSRLYSMTRTSPSHLVSSSRIRIVGTVRLLIEHGADVSLGDKSHSTPLHLASSSGLPETGQLLIEHGADVNARDGSHSTPLHLALLNSETARTLVKHGADVEARDWTHSTPLHLASSSRSVDSVRLLIELGADVNAQDRGQKTPLHLASSSRSPETVGVLIKHGADVNMKDGSHRTPLHLASSSWSPETVRALIEHGADVNARDGSDLTPLHMALPLWNPGILRLLIEHGADVNIKDENHSTPLHLALSKRSAETVLLLIKHGADVNAQDGSHKVPLYLALSTWGLEIVRALVKNGADVNARDRNHSAPLHLALSKRSADTVLLLIKHGADVNAHDGSHKAPLHLALPSWGPEIARVLVKHGADVNTRDGSYSTPLHLASFSRSVETVRLLIKHGADVNVQDGSQSTPLHLASYSRSPETVWLLIGHGADVNIKDGRHRTPLHLASSKGCPEIVQLLIGHGADVDAQDGSSLTPLHLASFSKNTDTVKLLIKHGADVNAQAQDGSHSTPLHLAFSSWSLETMRLFIKHGADVNARDRSHKTPLHLASYQDERLLVRPHQAEPGEKLDEKAEIVRLLIQHGADVTARDENHSTPLHLASSKGSGETVKLLIQCGAYVNARDRRHLTPLHLAASSRLALDGAIVHLLLSHGANVDAKDDGGRTPFQIASSRGFSKIAQLLSDHHVGGE